MSTTRDEWRSVANARRCVRLKRRAWEVKCKSIRHKTRQKGVANEDFPAYIWL